MTQTEAFYLILNSNIKGEHLFFSLINESKKVLIQPFTFDSFLLNFLCNLAKHKVTYATIFVFDLQQCLKFINTSQCGHIKTFSFKNILYSLTYSDVTIPKTKIIFKDCAHFLYDSQETDNVKRVNLLKMYHAKIKNKFNIDIYGYQILSLVGLAKTIFKTISPDKCKLIKRLNEKEDTFIRNAFYGGRTEIIEPIYKKTCYFYDVNSLYPFIMKNHPMPIGIPKYVAKLNLGDLKNFYGIVNVHVRVPNDMSLPILPIRSPNKNSDMGILYPQGEFKTICFSEELKYALEYGYEIIELFDGYSFQNNLLFDDFVKELYDWRKAEKDNDTKKFIKLLMNSLYGRYGAVYEENRYITNNNFPEAVTRKFENVTLCVAIAAFGRMFMYDVVVKHNLVSQLIYWDTDSIIIKTPLPSSNISLELGAFKVVATISKLLCLATKFYMYKIGKKYHCVFRGFKKKDYKIKGNILYNYLLNELNTPSIDPKRRFLRFNIENKKGALEIKNFIFHQKRKSIYINRKIMTEPWVIASI